MTTEFLNLYIEQLNNMISDLTKQHAMTHTQLKYTEILNAGLQEKIQNLELAVEKSKKKKGVEPGTF